MNLYFNNKIIDDYDDANLVKTSSCLYTFYEKSIRFHKNL